MANYGKHGVNDKHFNIDVQDLIAAENFQKKEMPNHVAMR